MKLLNHKRKSARKHLSLKPKKPKIEIKDEPAKQLEMTETSKPLQALLKDKEKLSKISHLVSPDLTYTKLKYKSEVYSVGDVCLIFSSTETLIGEITRILPVNGIKDYPKWPSVEIRWYYKKSDLNRKKNHLTDIKNFNAVSEFELFPSKHKDIIFIETILCKCKVLSYDEYENLQEHNENTYFTRASYDPVTQMLTPRFEEWTKGCVCRKPLNPDQFYIKCDRCNGWFHPGCCGINESQVEELKEFFCPACTKERNKQQQEEKNKE